MASSPLTKLRKLCLALPEAHEVEDASSGNHHGAGRPAVWLKAAPGNQALMVRAAPDRYFVPPYVGPRGWVGVWLDQTVDWDELADLLRDAWRLTAPTKLLAPTQRRKNQPRINASKRESVE